MLEFIKKYKLTILFTIIILLGIACYFVYNYVKNHVGTYEPSHEEVEYSIEKREVNEYRVIYKHKDDVIRDYYKDFIRLVLDDPVSAYNHLTNECKETTFKVKYENFKNRVDGLDRALLYKSDVKQYTIDNDKIIVIDTSDSVYIFYEEGVWNYKVNITR